MFIPGPNCKLDANAAEIANSEINRVLDHINEEMKFDLADEIDEYMRGAHDACLVILRVLGLETRNALEPLLDKEYYYINHFHKL